MDYPAKHYSFVDAKITNSNENKANPGNYSTQGFTGDPEKVWLDITYVCCNNKLDTFGTEIA